MKKTDSEITILWTTASLGITMVACTAIGLAIGLFLDKHLKTGSVLTIIFFALGIAAGIKQVVRELSKKQ
ncbi:MAG: AtpZ/AtpI family protein [Candidatus Omnitrophica bacterium]|nr:AtpZ/AtpI family protein [Candidatus Omnitrophota bacterium]